MNAPIHSRGGLARDERPILVLVLVLAGLAAWLRGGTFAPWTWPLPWLALAGLVIMLAWPRIQARLAGPQDVASIRPFLRSRDPVFVLGLVFLGLLLLQWWNAGRMLYFDAANKAWTYSEPRWAWLPSAITASEARQMLDWFVPAWVVLLAMRSPRLSSRGVRTLWRGLAYQAAALALFGILQYCSGTTHMYGFIPMRPHFFASFGYPNHAGSYFLMSLCLAGALLSWDLAPGGGRTMVYRRLALAAVILLCFMGALLALSRYAIIMGTLVMVAQTVFLVLVIWSRLKAVQRVHLIAVCVACLSLAGLLVVGIGREGIRKEFKPEQDQKTFVTRETDFRWFQLQSAMRIWRDHPWVGVGGWGYRYLIGHYLPPEEWRRINEGKANVHNDPVQFLAEFGLVGAGCMAGVVVLLGWTAWRNRHVRNPLWVLPLVGCGLVAAQSLIDLPFRSPAVLLLWLILLAGVGRVLPAARPADPGGRPQIS